MYGDILEPGYGIHCFVAAHKYGLFVDRQRTQYDGWRVQNTERGIFRITDIDVQYAGGIVGHIKSIAEYLHVGDRAGVGKETHLLELVVV